MVPGLSPGGKRAEGGESSGSENETRWVAAGPPGWAMAGLVAAPGLAVCRDTVDCQAWHPRPCKPSGG
jgi:hypothetical protein